MQPKQLPSRENGYLVVISSQAEFDYLDDQILNSSVNDDLFMGLYQDAGSSNWQWVTTESGSFSNWLGGTPPSTTGQAGVMIQWSNPKHQWYNQSKGAWKEYILEVPCSGGGNNPANVNISGPVITDQGGNTVSLVKGQSWPAGVYTVTYTGTDPCGNSETCAFTVTVQNTGCSQPAITNYDSWGIYNDAKYYRSTVSKTWDAAKTSCEQINGYLVVYSSQGEFEFIEDQLIANNISDDIFMGLHQNAGSSTWQWVATESGSYTNWIGGTPPSTTGQAAVTVNWSNPSYQWYNQSKGAWKQYVCEVPCSPGNNRSGSTTAIEDVELFAPNFAIYPNPAQHKLTVNLADFMGQEMAIDIYDSFGKRVYSRKLDKNHQSEEMLQLNELSAGLYMLTAGQSGKSVLIRRFVIQK